MSAPPPPLHGGPLQPTGEAWWLCSACRDPKLACGVLLKGGVGAAPISAVRRAALIVFGARQYPDADSTSGSSLWLFCWCPELTITAFEIPSGTDSCMSFFSFCFFFVWVVAGVRRSRGRQINYLVYRYLQESGFVHSAFTFAYESLISKSVVATQLGGEVPPGTLVAFLQKGLQLVAIEHRIQDDGSERAPGADDDAEFTLLTVGKIYIEDRSPLPLPPPAQAQRALGAGRDRASTFFVFVGNVKSHVAFAPAFCALAAPRVPVSGGGDPSWQERGGQGGPGGGGGGAGRKGRRRRRRRQAR